MSDQTLVQGPEQRFSFKNYLEEDKGVIKGMHHNESSIKGLTSAATSHDGSACNVSFLEAILHNLMVFRSLGAYRYSKKILRFKARKTKARVRMASATRKGEKGNGLCKMMVACLASTLLELKRLQEHPELYPSKAVKQNFLRSVHKDCNLMLKRLFPSGKALVRDRKAFRKALEEENRKRVLPTYDEQRTSWQQFLHDHAPSSGVSLPVGRAGESLQVLPQAGLRLLLEVVEKSRAVKRALLAVSPTS